MTPKFTLISFSCHLVDVEDNMNQATPLAIFLESTKEHRVEIYLGTYVFDTQKGWHNMHLLCEFLRARRQHFVRLPFEAEVFGHISPVAAQALTKAGVVVFQYPKHNP